MGEKLRYCTIESRDYYVCDICKTVFFRQGLNLCPKGCGKMLEKVLVRSGSNFDDYEIDER